MCIDAASVTSTGSTLPALVDVDITVGPVESLVAKTPEPVGARVRNALSVMARVPRTVVHFATVSA